MKKHRITRVEVLVNCILFAGLFAFLWQHRSNDSERRLILLIGFGVIALINLKFFYWSRYGDPDFDADEDDVERFKWEMVILQSVVFLGLWILTSFLVPR
jgi:ABC-type uncharacterized transport system permease subunit